jgi:hypothetical protein
MGTVLSAITAKQLSLSNTEKHKERTQKKLIPQHYFSLWTEDHELAVLLAVNFCMWGGLKTTATVYFVY